ncbi:MAG: 4-hydroxythreonine-4-phosphate dehydrogenase PdxA [Prevotella sp.]|jgi:4-hydroxythreonine-4-phosphate dehydrogenase|nr:4-hydroxythreonine-4-phosphate dehydrogenase PdxA [Prevotella sp.]
MENRKIRVGITHGDTNSVGYELIFKTFSEPALLDLCTPIVYGSPKIATYHRKVLGIEANFTIIRNAEEAHSGRLNILTTIEEDVKMDMGMPTKESGDAAIRALDRAMKDYQEGLFDVLVTTPMTLDKIKDEGYPFNSQVDYITKYVDTTNKPLKIITNRGLRIAFATDKMPISEVSGAISQELISDKLTVFAETLKRDFRISQPRIAVLALNPKSSENGKNGKEEEEIIKPAIDKVNEARPIVFGPFAADEFFTCRQYEAFDGILAMYYDQASAPFKLIASEDGVCLTAGMPIVHTYSSHDVDFAAAGKGTVDESSFRDAIYLAIDVARNRVSYDKPFANPLKKLYHEKRDDSEKVRFQIKENKEPKKQENAEKEQ